MSIEETRTEKQSTPSIADRAAAGARWLDKHEPGWVDRIDLETLDLGDCDRCIGGQLVGDYWSALRRWQSEDDDADGFVSFWWSDIRGFSLPADVDDSVKDDGDYEDLTAEWRRLITARRVLAS